MSRAEIFSIIFLAVFVSPAPGDEPKTITKQMSHQKNIVMYMARAVAVGDWKETSFLSTLLEEEMRNHAKAKDGNPETRTFEEQIKASSEAMRIASAADDDQGVVKSFSSLITACLSCHRVLAPQLRLPVR